MVARIKGAILYGCPLWLLFFVFNPNEKGYNLN
jgi:hypothetical protein